MTEELRISNSSIKNLLRCEQMYSYHYVEGLSPKRQAIPLKLGSWIHRLLEIKYRDGDWRPAQDQLTLEFNRMLPEEREYYGDLPAKTTAIMKGYEYAWRHDDEDWNIIDTEIKVELPLKNNWLYVGKIDVAAENEEGLWLWDHKTFRGKAPNSDYRTADPQSALYDWAYEKLFGVKAVGFIFNYLRTKLPSTPKLLKRGGISKAKTIDTDFYTLARFLKANKMDPKEYRAELAAARARDRLFYDRVFIPRPTTVIENLLKDIVQLMPRIKELHEGRRPVRTLTRECSTQCAFNLLCLTELTGGDPTYIKKHDFEVRPWEEYDDVSATPKEE